MARRVAVAGLAVLAACGSGDGGGTVGGGGRERAGWSSVALGVDDEGDVAVEVVTGSGPPVIVAGARPFAAWVVDGDRVERAEVPELPWRFFDLGGATRGPDPESPLVAVGVAHLDDDSSRPGGLVSADGARWEPVTDDDLAVPGVLSDVAATADGFVAVGGRIDPTSEYQDELVPAAWRSVDGRAWEQLDLDGVGGPDGGGGAGLTAVAADGERLWVSDSAGTWVSPDGGETWERGKLPPVGGAPVGGGEGGFLLVGAIGGVDEGSRVVAWTSPDGEAWEPASPPEGLLDRVAFPLAAATPRGFVVGGDMSIEAFADPAACYVDIVACGQNRGVVAALEDGEWSLLDTTGAGDPASWRPDALAVSDDDLLVVTPGGGFTLWRHDLAGLRRLEPPEPPALTGPPLVESGAQLDVGRTYRYPLYVHCGAGYLGQFNGQHWYAVPGEGIDDEDLNDARLPIVQNELFGEMTVVSEDRIEYRAGDVLVNAYQPKPDEPPTCE
jgi:hypothetical protein